MTTPQISLVIPAYNEAVLLPRLLDSVDVARARLGGANAVEVIVADNQSTDATAELALARDCRVARVEKRCIGAARNGGAAIARGEIVAFVDADIVIHPDSFSAIAAAMGDPRVIGGATGVTLDRWSAGRACTYAMMLPMIWLTGFDTGVVFCRRLDFAGLGGYDESRLVAEDVHFLWRLKRLAHSRRQRMVRVRRCKGVASTRKFDRYGDWHYFTQLPAMAIKSFGNSRTLTDFARRYWYEDR